MKFIYITPHQFVYTAGVCFVVERKEKQWFSYFFEFNLIVRFIDKCHNIVVILSLLIKLDLGISSSVDPCVPKLKCCKEINSKLRMFELFTVFIHIIRTCFKPKKYLWI